MSRVKASTVNPDAPVWDKKVKEALVKEATPFDIVRVGSFVSPQYGATWRLNVVRTDTGEPGLLLFAGNQVRDERFGGFADALRGAPGNTIGPCKLVLVKLPGNRGKGRDTTYEIADAEDEEEPTP